MSRPGLLAAFNDLPERVVELRIVDRQNRAAAELPDETRQPDRSHRQRQPDIKPAQADALAMKVRRDQPPEIHETHHQDDDGDLADPFGLAFDRTRQQKHERHREMEQDKSEADEAPARVRTM